VDEEGGKASRNSRGKTSSGEEKPTYPVSTLEKDGHVIAKVSRRKRRLHDPPLATMVVSLRKEDAATENHR
jgi:hypothetical protein